MGDIEMLKRRSEAPRRFYKYGPMNILSLMYIVIQLSSKATL